MQRRLQCADYSVCAIFFSSLLVATLVAANTPTFRKQDQWVGWLICSFCLLINVGILSSAYTRNRFFAVGKALWRNLTQPSELQVPLTIAKLPATAQPGAKKYHHYGIRLTSAFDGVLLSELVSKHTASKLSEAETTQLADALTSYITAAEFNWSNIPREAAPQLQQAAKILEDSPLLLTEKQQQAIHLIRQETAASPGLSY